MKSRLKKSIPCPPAKKADSAGTVPARALCLGNELLGDDAFGIVVAEHLRRLRLAGVDVVDSAVTGFHLLDHILGTRHLLVIDTVLTGAAPPGTLYRLDEHGLESVPGPSPHYIGLFEALEVARKLGLPVPAEVTILAVEAADCTTVGGPMHPRVAAAVPVVARLGVQLLRSMSGVAAPATDSEGNEVQQQRSGGDAAAAGVRGRLPGKESRP